MTVWALFIKGLGLGFSIAAPVGPIGVLCIQCTLKKGFPSGFFSGLGAASADLLYGALAAFGAMWLGSNLVQFQVPLRVVGGLVLIFMGVRAFLQQQTQEQTPASDKRGLLADYGSTFLLTLTNPITIFSFTAMYAGLTVYDLEELELAYAPPYSSSRDPVNIVGFAAGNFLRGDVKLMT